MYNTICTKCGGAGHIALECFNSSNIKYDLIPEDKPVQRETLRRSEEEHKPAVGRGRSAVIPAWMTSDTAFGDSARKRKIDGDSERKDSSKKHKKEKKEKKEKKGKKEKKEKKERKEKKGKKSKREK